MQQNELTKTSSRIDNLNVRKDNVKAIKHEILHALNSSRQKLKVENLF